jgi:hypothetical protein
MDAVFKKLNFKDQKQVLVLNAPESFGLYLDSIKAEAEIFYQPEGLEKVEFFIGFATRQREVDEMAMKVCPKLSGDAIFWICYPKGTSKKYKCDFNRDNGWAVLGKFNLEGVRMVAIDEDWSALRFRRLEFIKNLSRNEKMVLSEAAKERLKK